MEQGSAKQYFEPCLQSVLKNMFPESGKWDVILPGLATWCPPGAVFTYAGSMARLSLGIMSGLSISVELVKAIADLNQTFVGGFFWLVEGQSGTWQVLWATKMQWEYFQSTDFMVQWTVQVIEAAPRVLSIVQDKLTEFGGHPWWNDELGSAPQALVLMGNAS